MKEKKISLSFVKKGEPFIMPHLTVGKQDEYMEAISKIEKNEKDIVKKNREINKQMVLKTLQVIDENITIDDINNMHPSDFAYLSDIVWTKGRELKGEEEDFQKPG